MELGRRIRKLRESRGLKPADVATRIGVSIAELQKYEAEEAEPNAVLLGRIARFLG